MTRHLIAALTVLTTLAVAACDIDQAPAYATDASETLSDAHGDAADTSLDAPDGTWRRALAATSAGPEPPPDPAPSSAPARTRVSITVLPSPEPAAPAVVVAPVTSPTPVASTKLPAKPVVPATPVSPAPESDDEAEPEPFDGEDQGTRVYWGPKGKRLAAMITTFEGGGSGWSDMDGLIVRLRDRAVRHKRVIAEAEAADNEDGVDPRMVRRAKTFDALLLRRGYTLSDGVATEDVEHDNDSDVMVRTVAITEGPHTGLELQVQAIGRNRVRVWAKAPGKVRYSLGTAKLPMETCWTMEHPDEVDLYEHAIRRGNRICEVGSPGIGGVWVAPSGRHVALEVWSSPGAGCRTDTMTRLFVGRLR